jgi:hypothetical protein
MILSRIRFGNYFHERRCQDHADRKETSPRRAVGSHLLCPDAGRLVGNREVIRLARVNLEWRKE